MEREPSTGLGWYGHVDRRRQARPGGRLVSARLTGEKEERVQGSRTIPAAAVALGLMIGLSVSAMAQDEELAAPAAYATGAIGWPPAELIRPEVQEVPGGTDELGLQLIDLPVDFSDPRLSGVLTISGNGTTRDLADGRAWIESRTHRIVNEDGAWAGSGYLVRATSDELGLGVDQQSMLLVGKGGYDGLIAYVYLDAPDEGPGTWQARILEAEQPPLPDHVPVE